MAEAKNKDRLSQIKSLEEKLNLPYSKVVDSMDLTKEEKEKYLKDLEENLQTA